MADTAEALGIALLVGALTSGSVTAAATMATVRPSLLVALLGRPKQLVVGALVAIAMRILAMLLFQSGATSGLFNLTWPLVGYLQEPSAAPLLVAGAALATFLIGAIKRRPAWIGTGLLVMMFGAPVLANGFDTVRAAGALPVIWRSITIREWLV